MSVSAETWETCGECDRDVNDVSHEVWCERGQDGDVLYRRAGRVGERRTIDARGGRS